jgi:hypothetical protein
MTTPLPLLTRHRPVARGVRCRQLRRGRCEAKKHSRLGAGRYVLTCRNAVSSYLPWYFEGPCYHAADPAWIALASNPDLTPWDASQLLITACQRRFINVVAVCCDLWPFLMIESPELAQRLASIERSWAENLARYHHPEAAE